MSSRLLALALFLSTALSAAQKEEPVGLMLTPGGAQLLRAGTETPLSARAGDLLFTGDGLRTGSSAATFLFCPSKTVDTLSPAGEVRFDARQAKARLGKISEQPARACALPQTLRVAVASQQHYGVTMTRGVAGDVRPTPRDQLPPAVQSEIAALEQASDDSAAVIAIAGVFEKHNLPANALESYHKLRARWPDAVWVKSKIFELEESAAAQSAVLAAAASGGKTYALLIGISKYKKPELALQFAHADARVFGQFLESPRGGALPSDQVLVLTDEQATTAAVRNGFQTFLKSRAGKQDTVILLLAGHGTVEVPGSRSAYILTYNADPQDLASTALPMAELRSLFEEQLKKVGRVLLFVDVCKAGVIGSIQNTTVNSDVQNLGEVEGDLFGLLASRPKEVSLEGPQFGGGHGSFSYFVMKGLGGAADANTDGAVDADELIRYVTAQVPAATGNKQHPREFGSYDNSMRLSDIRKPGIDLARRRGRPVHVASAAPGPAAYQEETPVDSSDLSAALRAGRLLPGQPANAFEALKRLEPLVSQERYRELSNQVRIALEDGAQDVLLRYLAGDQNPQARGDFAHGASYMKAARTLTRESLLLEARELFFEGRALLFDKRFREASALLEQSIRLDPGAAYAYNALGIAYLEQARFDRAIAAFRDAARRAQHWSYPLHNQALANVESGNYRSAIAAYQEAIRRTPEYSYLSYNLGLLYQRLNRTKDAETAYRKAIALAPQSADAYNAMGTLSASRGKRAEAERWYRDSLARNPELLPARHNLGLLLVADRGRRSEAIGLWKENLRRSPDFMPSLLSLAENADPPEAIETYRKVLTLKPDYVAAHVALGALLLQSGDRAAALLQLRDASRLDPQNPAIFERIGDAESASGHAAEARTAYQHAMSLVRDRANRNRLAGKLK